ncbi:hypothetical protein OF83DRAFT_1101206 [Amylostereum chailletii]|nr:hypothetical protein OF83DRAFT_1101206 [Amylostereum chailletii]
MFSRLTYPPRVVGRSARRLYATVEAPVIVAKPPLPPLEPPPKPSRNLIDSFLLTQLANTPSSSRTSLPQLIQQYLDNSSHVLEPHLPYEPQPSPHRRISFDSADTPVHLIAHVVQEGGRSKITLSSGFAIQGSGDLKGRNVVVSCAHTLEEIRWSPLLVLPNWSSSSPNLSLPDLPHARSSGSFLVSQGPNTARNPTDTSALVAHPITAILSSLHRSDLVTLASPVQSQPIRTLPVSPYPALPGTRVRAHFVSETRPHGEESASWKPWPGGWSKWVSGRVLGYRDFAGREAQPGTYDSLSHMLFEPLPTPGSSGGPIVDEDTGAVVGVVLGTRMDNRIEGTRGWGVPSEAIFEMFSLPGINVSDRGK